MKKIFSVVLSTVLFLNLTAGEDSTKNVILINNWLVAGPVTVKKPAFFTEKNVKGKSFKISDLLKQYDKEVKKPDEGKTFLSVNDSGIKWTAKKDFKGFSTSGKDFKKGWQAVYLFNDRFEKVTLKIKTRQCFELYIDGKKRLSNTSCIKKDKNPADKSTPVYLERGKHLIVIKSLFNPENQDNWSLEAKLSFDKKYPHNSILIDLSPKTYMDINHLMNGTRLTGISTSYDGKYILKEYKKIVPPNGKSESWFEISETGNGNIIYTSEYANIYDVKWSPVDNAVSFKAEDVDKKKIFLLNLNNLSKKTLLENAGDVNYYSWSPTGDFIIYSIDEEPKKDNDGVIHVLNPMDRWPWWRYRGQLYKCNVAYGTTERLTYGYLSNNLQDIRPDGKKILFSQSVPDFKKRPYTKQIMLELDLQTFVIDTVWSQNYGGSAQYSPDGTKLLVTGSASMFDGAGINLPEKLIPNDYDTQAYIFDLKTKKAEPVTRNFNPSVFSAKWLKKGKGIIFRVEDKTRNKLYRYDIEKKTFADLKAKVDMVSGFDIPSSTENFIVYYGSSMQYPSTGWKCTITGTGHKKIADPEKEFFADVVFGKTENWNFKNKYGKTIEGRVYYPPDYDENKKYPVIVYYYGGTSPTGRSFRGRYPKNLFAAQGYIVYVLQPSGATGFGQYFSALHVNDWGKRVADEIIKGTKDFLKAHPSANAKKVGCMGASYGGFMTMLLTTKTDIFATAIEHAGISSIASYWGQGYWGYLYSSVASAGNFPWNNKDLYCGQSPLFNADKVKVPLLLLHGTSDTNVPTGESIQMFTALKLLGKPVELVEIKGQNHHITDYKKRILWQKTILAWFDKWLKDQNEWWNYLYPEENL